MTISILLAEDHQIVRQGLRALLVSEPDFVLVGEATNGLEALELAERQQPAVLVLDLMMPGLHGLEVIRRLRQTAPRTRVVVLSMHSTEAYVLEALRYGANAYLLKDSSIAELAQAVRAAAVGQRYLGAPLSQHAIEAYLERAHAAPLDPYETLTDRERQVLQLAAEGFGAAEIAARLSISPRTVETHRSNLMRKLELHGQSDVIRFALRRGLLPLTD
ncbi:MAG: response regulator transcription factor [Chloroflexi bacterium]|nr:response regulator transcription factor [Chloroflexota bacterium]